jgi:fructose-1,6-bisphosphatase/inositol monophosphatase family enzyme
MFSKPQPSGLRRDEISKKIEANTKMLAWGGDCYMYGLLARGNMDACVEASLSPYDFCALVPVVENAQAESLPTGSGNKLTIKSDGRGRRGGRCKNSRGIAEIVEITCVIPRLCPGDP